MCLNKKKVGEKMSFEKNIYFRTFMKNVFTLNNSISFPCYSRYINNNLYIQIADIFSFDNRAHSLCQKPISNGTDGTSKHCPVPTVLLLKPKTVHKGRFTIAPCPEQVQGNTITLCFQDSRNQ